MMSKAVHRPTAHQDSSRFYVKRAKNHRSQVAVKYTFGLPLSGLLWSLSLLTSAPMAMSQQAERPQLTDITTTAVPATLDWTGEPPPAVGRRFGLPPTSEDFSAYHLGPGDAIAISVTPRSRDLSVNATLDWDGNITMPLLGTLSLQGLSLEQAEQRLQQRLASYLVNPQVGVTLATARSTRVMVTGEVVNPGFYALSEPKLPNALMEAGGTTHLADLRAVHVRRRTNTAAMQEEQFDLYTPLLEGSDLPDLRLVDGDVISISPLTPETMDAYNRNLIAGVNVSQREITIRVLDYSSGVNRLQLTNGSDFLDALTSIKPNLNDTNLRKVNLVRFDPATGHAIVVELNARDALRGDVSQNPPLQHNDVIVINRNAMAQFNRFLSQLTQPFQDTLSFLLFFDTARNGVSTVLGGEQESR